MALPILLLDCSAILRDRLANQGFNIQLGTTGYCTGEKCLPSQLYENMVIIYNPEKLSRPPSRTVGTARIPGAIRDLTPQFSLNTLTDAIKRGATVLVFANKLTNDPVEQDEVYSWIPFMPRTEFTHDNRVGTIDFQSYPASKVDFLSPIIMPSDLSMPIYLKLDAPEKQQFEDDVFVLIWNAQGDCLGVIILRGHGRLIVLPKFDCNDAVIDIFLNRVIPRIYESKTRATLIDLMQSPAERKSQEKLSELQAEQATLEKQLVIAMTQVASDKREKTNVITKDPTAKQILIYYDQAMKSDATAVFYLYKIVEAVENKYGGEGAAIAAVGEQVSWKAVKRIANETYRDARHAPKPTDVVKPCSVGDLKVAFENTKKVVLAYFVTLF